MKNIKRKPKILIVEDYEIYCKMEAKRLEMIGYDTEISFNGKEAFDKYLSCEPFTYQLIIMDIYMPVMDGRETAKLIRKSGRADSLTIPILSISADIDPESIKLSLMSGIDDFLPKPINFLLLCKKIESMIYIDKLVRRRIENTKEKEFGTGMKKYSKLWNLLIEKKMSKTDLKRTINCSTTTLAKLSKGEDVSITILRRICEKLDCSIDDIVSIDEK